MADQRQRDRLPPWGVIETRRSARSEQSPQGQEFGKGIAMIKEEDVLAALDKPRAVYALKTRLDPSNKSTDALQELLLRMRAEGKVKFDIHSGKWRKA
jgi:hypothetical protein